MDFFGQQDRARASTKRLVILFVLAVALTNLAIYLALAGVFQCTHLFAGLSSKSSRQGWFIKLANHFAVDGFWNWELLGWVTLFVTAVVGLVTAWKLRQLSGAGGVPTLAFLGNATAAKTVVSQTQEFVVG